jgi:sugar lactone lactonase YvrE
MLGPVRTRRNLERLVTRHRLLALLLAIITVPLAISGARRATVAVAAPGDISTFAGGGAGDGGGATNAAVSPAGVAADGAGNIFIADSANCRVRKVSGGIITTIAGDGVCGYAGDGGAATAARLDHPQAVAVDSAGSLYISDTSNCRIRKVTGGVITTMAGNGACSFSGDGGAPTSAALSQPRGLVSPAAGVLYVADSANCRVRKITAATITTTAGNGACGFSGDGGAAAAAGLSHPRGVALDSTGTLYIADTDNCRVRVVVFPAAEIYTAAGTGTCSFGGDGTVATSAPINGPQAVATDAAGDLYIADTTNCRLRKVTFPAATIATIAGTGACTFTGDGTAATAALNAPAGLATSTTLGVIIGDTANCRVRAANAGAIATIAGTGGCAYGGDGGQAMSAAISWLGEIALDSANNLYIADSANCRIRKVTATSGVIATIAGSGVCDFSGDGGAATSAAFDQPHGVAVDAAGNVYIADTNNCRVRKRDVSSGTIATIAGTGICGYGGDNGPAISAALNYPESVAVYGSTVVIADTFNCRVRRIIGTTITTVAGTGACSYSGDGGAPGLAALTFPYSVAADAAGNIYVADTFNCRVRKIAGGTISLLAGDGACAYAGDNGAATSASLNMPGGLAVTAAGSVYVADTGNCRVRLVSGGAIVTAAGAGTGVAYGGCAFGGDGGPAAGAQLDRPQDVAVTAAGTVYIADGLNRRIRALAAGADSDGDGVPDASDNCMLVANAGQQNNDRNFTDLPPTRSFDDLTLPYSDDRGDICDPDDDNDGLPDSIESGGPPCATAGGPTDPLLADSDGDRALDGAECALGTDPTNAASKPALPSPAADPDHDGLSTAFELTIGTNANSADTDGDGLPDGIEYKAHNTNPLSVNTDGDTCGDGKEVASVNGDTVVNSFDLGLVAWAYGYSSNPNYILDFDANRDGAINSIDLALVARGYGPCV